MNRNLVDFITSCVFLFPVYSIEMDGLTARMRGFFLGSSAGSASAQPNRERVRRHSTNSVGETPSGRPIEARSDRRRPNESRRPASYMPGLSENDGVRSGENMDDTGDMQPVSPVSPQAAVQSSGSNNVNIKSGTEENPYTTDFKFPADKSIQIRLVPYNPFFPVVEKEMTNGQVFSIGRHQRHGNAEDPFNEGIYFRSTVVSRKHAQLMFIDGEVIT